MPSTTWSYEYNDRHFVVLAGGRLRTFCSLRYRHHQNVRILPGALPEPRMMAGHGQPTHHPPHTTHHPPHTTRPLTPTHTDTHRRNSSACPWSPHIYLLRLALGLGRGRSRPLGAPAAEGSCQARKAHPGLGPRGTRLIARAIGSSMVRDACRPDLSTPTEYCEYLLVAP